MAKLFVGNFSFSIDEGKLREYFSQVGTVLSAKVMTEGPGGRSRGFGFVEMSTAEEAQKAIQELDGKPWEGRPIKVSEDRSNRRHDHGAPHEGSGPREGGYSGGGSSYGGGSSFGGGSSYGGGHSDRQHGGGDEGHHQRGAAPGYFKAQPLELSFRRKKKVDPFTEDENLKIDYKDPKLLSRFMSERGRILPRRMTGLNSLNQRQVTRAIKRAQHIALLPYTRG